MREYVSRNKEERAAYLKSRYENNKEIILEKQRKYYDKNREEMNKKSREAHRKYDPEYHILTGMKARCSPNGNPQHKRYRDLKIKVHESWCAKATGYPAFRQYLLDTIGLRPSPQHTIDRYPNRSGNYEPGNLRWAVAIEQSDNRWNTPGYTSTIPDDSPIYYPFGILTTLLKFSNEVKIPLVVARYRYAQNWEADHILDENYGKRLHQYKGHNYTISELSLIHAEIHGYKPSKLSYIQISQRIKVYKWSAQKAVETPFR